MSDKFDIHTLSEEQLLSLETKTEDLLQRYRPVLLKTLRWMGEGYIIPNIHLENITKHIVRNCLGASRINHKTQIMTHYGPIVFTIKKFNTYTNMYTILMEQPHKETFEIGITRDRDTTLRTYTYLGKTYQELPESGNSYNHMVSQAKNMIEFTIQDLEVGLLNEKEASAIRLANNFHDIPEYKTEDIISSLKTDAQRLQEHKVAEEIIDKTHRSSEEKYHLLAILQLIEKDSKLFKTYEWARWIKDAQIAYDRQHLLSENKNLSAKIIAGIWRFDAMITLPNGKKINAGTLPSIRSCLQEHAPLINNCLDEIATTHYHGFFDDALKNGYNLSAKYRDKIQNDL